MSVIAFTQAPTVVQTWTPEFMSYGTSAGGAPTAQHMQKQANDWDAVCPNAFAGGPYSAAIMDQMRSSTYRDPVRGNLYFIGYGNDGAVLVDRESASPTDLTSDRPYDIDHYAYQASDAGTTPATGALRLTHVSRVPSGNYVAAVWKNDYIDQHIAYYKEKLERADPDDPSYDAVMVDVMGPFPAQDVANMQPRPWNHLHPADTTTGGFTVNEWLDETANMTAKMKQGGVTAGSQWADPPAVIPNGIVNGTKYKVGGGGGVNTKRLATNGDGGMVELFVKGEYFTSLNQVTDAIIVDSAEMLEDAESLSKTLLCVSKCWTDQGGTEAARLAFCKSWFRMIFAIWLLGANGRSFFGFRDDRPAEDGGTHRALFYPPGVTDTGTPTTGRRRQFYDQFFPKFAGQLTGYTAGDNKTLPGTPPSGSSIPQTTLTVDDTTGWPTSGTVRIGITGSVHTITYTGKTLTSLTGCSGGSGKILAGQPVLGPTVRVYDNARALGPGTHTYEANVSGITGLYRRVFGGSGTYTGGVVWINNTGGNRTITTPTGAHHDIDGTAYTSGQSVVVPNKGVLILTKDTASTGYSYSTSAATSITSTTATLNAATTDLTAGVTAYVSIEGGTETAMTPGTVVGGSKPWTYAATGLVAGTTYNYVVIWRNDLGVQQGRAPTSGSATFTTAGDTTAPAFPGGAFIGYILSPSAIDLTWTPATDAVGVVKYIITRTGGSGTVIFEVLGGPPAAGMNDTTVGISIAYVYSIVAVDAAGNVSSAITLNVTSSASSGGGAGWAAGRLGGVSL